VNLRYLKPLIVIVLVLGVFAVLFSLFYGGTSDSEPISSDRIPGTIEDAEFVHSGEALRLEILGGSTVRYLVGEQLARRDLPNDAIGVTGQVEGLIVLDGSGAIDQENSEIVVMLESLESDEPRRDNYLRTRTSIGSPEFPKAVFIPQEVSGLDWPIGEGDRLIFDMVGQMTIRGVTNPMTWSVEAFLDQGVITGQAKTSIYFSDYQIPKPTLLFILSMDDEIRLEADLLMGVSRR